MAKKVRTNSNVSDSSAKKKAVRKSSADKVEPVIEESETVLQKKENAKKLEKQLKKMNAHVL